MRGLIHSWEIFWWAYFKQRRKRRGAGKAPMLQAIFIASCAQWIVYHKHLGLGLPWYGRLAQWTMGKR
jgi:hypothetical protein